MNNRPDTTAGERYQRNTLPDGDAAAVPAPGAAGGILLRNPQHPTRPTNMGNFPLFMHSPF
ncbi:TPA: hypothetical protein N2E30_002309 [Salmonella enterica]|uniref:hypothetical protein n=1 Tax=Salmonella enterica TaxID=28901 RepID=UPI0009AD512D|nr:hypothetical protein [Salmonella enterica]EEB4297026.1 hypothetical protein [Salmonella enterica]EKA0076524.1 hypothetical protein [Salmonella enterica]ELC1249364.1 hypothetical protein [Salmonella enterica]HCL4789040.1 hypothetical protein [Salmonella enterica]